MRFVRISLLAALSVGALACSEPDTGPFIAKVPPTAIVRYINALPDTFSTTVRWIDDIEFTPQTFVGVAFREYGQGGWQGLKAGNRRFRVFTYQQNTNNFPVAGNTTVLADTTFNFEAGKYYTILHTGFTRTGSLPAAELRIFEDEPPAQPAAGTLLRVYNLAYGISYDLYMGTRTEAMDTVVTSVDTTITTDTTYTVAPGNASVDTTITVDTSIVINRVITSKDANIVRPPAAGGDTMIYLPAQVGTLIASGAPASAGTVVLPYTARPSAQLAGRLTAAGSLVTRGVRVLAPTGLAETADFEAAGGTNITGSVLTAWVFPRKTAGSFNSTAVAQTRASILFTIDRSPARTIAP
ncbi:MAG: DUF4397 domain-containing protein [Gemmatimonadaceae bacterium]|nr:DUF4397 domain-containing protein [Gemmatimonadaceae bacterium]MCW5825900.1 DUF4397 domain-containing protein [Gemmatimonadaceae bacterium]